MLRDWCLLNKPEDAVVLEQWAMALERISFQPPRLIWVQAPHQPGCDRVSVSSGVGVRDESEMSNVVFESVGMVPVVWTLNTEPGMFVLNKVGETLLSKKKVYFEKPLSLFVYGSSFLDVF
jgi:hypothetical protein